MVTSPVIYFTESVNCLFSYSECHSDMGDGTRHFAYSYRQSGELLRTCPLLVAPLSSRGVSWILSWSLFFFSPSPYITSSGRSWAGPQCHSLVLFSKSSCSEITVCAFQVSSAELIFAHNLLSCLSIEVYFGEAAGVWVVDSQRVSGLAVLAPLFMRQFILPAWQELLHCVWLWLLGRCVSFKGLPS